MISLQRLKDGAIASVLALASGITMLLITRTDAIEFAIEYPLYVIASLILIASAIGPLFEISDTIGQILLWNGVGWSAGLAFFGMESVGSMPIWPLMLAIMALAFWPRIPTRAVPPMAIAIALLGGFGLCWLGWSDVNIPIPTEWLEVQ